MPENLKRTLARTARLNAFLLLGSYFLMMGTGVIFETAAGSYFSGTSRWTSLIEVAVMTAWAVVGALLARRQPRHPIGWIWLAIAIIISLDHFTWGYAYFGLFTQPGSLPGVELAVVWNYWTGRTVALIPLTLLFLLFPTGRPPAPGWGRLAWIVIGAIALHLPVAALAPNPIGYFPFPLDILGASAAFMAAVRPIWWMTGIIPVLGTLLATISLVLRFRRSRDVERQQLKWFVFAATFFIPGVLLIVVSGRQPVFARDVVFGAGAIVSLLAITGMSIGSAIAILRYRLWDIDVIIRRTLIYGSLSLFLAMLYFGMVTMLQNVVTAATGQRSQAVIVVSTLAIAALFNPLRGRTQDVIDRRFYRQKYDAAEILARFGAAAQSEVEIENLTAELMAVVETTLEPESVSVLLRGP